MKNFNWSEFTKKIAIKCELSKIYSAWTVPNEIEAWFLSKANFYRNDKNQIDDQDSVKKGDHYEWSWFLYDVIEKGMITEANSVDHIQFTFAGTCIVDINLEEKENYVIVKLTQKKIPLDDDSKRGIRLGCESGWSFFLLNLKSVYEGGLDLRNKDNNLIGMLNN